MQRVFIPFLLSLTLVGCGKKAPPQPPPPPPKAGSLSPNGTGEQKPLPGRGGYFVGDGGYLSLYWSFPVKVDYSVILFDGKKIATTKGWNYLYPKPLERGKTYTFEVVGIKEGKPVAKVVITVSY